MPYPVASARARPTVRTITVTTTTTAIQPSTAQGGDTRLNKATPTTADSAITSFGLAGEDNASASYEIFSFPTSALVNTDGVITATLELTVNTTQASPRVYYLFRVLTPNSAWVRATATWNTRDGSTAWTGGSFGAGEEGTGASYTGIDVDPFPIGIMQTAGGEATGAKVQCSIDPATVQACIDATLPLHFVMKRLSNSSSLSPTFRAAPYTTDATLRPKLTLTSTVRVAPSITAKYCATTGNDSTGDGSIGNPWATPKKLMNELTRDQIGYIRGGIYTTTVNTDSNPNFITNAPVDGIKRVTVKSYPGEWAVLRGVWELANLNYVTIEDLDFTWNASAYPTGDASFIHNVKLRGGLGFVMRNCRIYNSIARSAMVLEDTPSAQGSVPLDGYLLDRLTVFNVLKPSYATNNQCHGIYVASRAPTTTGIIQRCSIYDMQHGDGIKVGHDTDPVGNVLIRYCTISNTPGDTDATNVEFSHRALNGTVEYCLLDTPTTGGDNVEQNHTSGLTGGVDYGNIIVRNCNGYASNAVMTAGTYFTDGGGNTTLDPSYMNAATGRFSPDPAGSNYATVRLLGHLSPGAALL